MGIFNWIKKAFKNESSTSAKTLDEMIDLILGGSETTSSGVVVNSNSAMRQATVYSCIRLLSETISQLPLFIYEKTPTGREKAENFYLFNTLKLQPNNYQTSSEFWAFMSAIAIMRGISCAYKVMVGSRIMELIPIAPDSVREEWLQNNERVFRVSFADGSYSDVKPEFMLCVRGLTLNGRDPVSPIRCAADTIGLSIAASKHTQRFFKNSARPSGLLEHPGALSPDKIDELRKGWEAQHGDENAGKIAILTAGLKFNTVSMTNGDAQLLEILGFNRTEICGIFGVPPHLVGAIEKTSSWGTGLAEQSLSFIKYTITPWLIRFEQSISRDLLTAAERKKYYPEFLTDQFLRGDTKSRYESYKTAIGGTQAPAFMTVNEVRKLENMPPLVGGDELYRPVSSNQTGEPTI